MNKNAPPISVTIQFLRTWLLLPFKKSYQNQWNKKAFNSVGGLKDFVQISELILWLWSEGVDKQNHSCHLEYKLKRGVRLIGHVNEYPIMHCFGKPRHTQSMTAYMILTEYFWKFRWKAPLVKNSMLLTCPIVLNLPNWRSMERLIPVTLETNDNVCWKTKPHYTVCYN